MITEERQLTRKELEKEYTGIINVFVTSINLEKSFKSSDYITPQKKQLTFPFDTVLKVHSWSISPMWFNNLYSNYLN